MLPIVKLNMTIKFLHRKIMVLEFFEMHNKDKGKGDYYD